MWARALRLFQPAPVTVETESLEGADPELCINLFQRGVNFIGVRDRLKAADQDWMESFLEQGGLFTLFDMLQSLKESGIDPVDAAVKVLDCVACIKAVMNSQVGLEYIIYTTKKKFLNILAEELDTNVLPVKMHIFEIFSAISIYSDEGHLLILNALKHYKIYSGQSHQFSKLIQELKSSQTDEYSTCVLAFINCLIASAVGLEERVHIRNEMIALQLQVMLTNIKTSAYDPLITQIDVFEESNGADSELLETKGIDLQSCEEMFHTVYEKVLGTPYSLNLLHILQSMVLIGYDSQHGNTVWPLLEELTEKAVLMNDPVRIESFRKQSIEIITEAINNEQERKQSLSFSISDVPPSFLTPPPQATPPSLPSPPPTVSSFIPPPPPLPSSIPLPPPLPSSVPPPPPLPSSVPPPPPLPSSPSSSTTTISSMFSASSSLPSIQKESSILDLARSHVPSKTMKKFNWQKLPKHTATKAGTLWELTSYAIMKFDIKVYEVEDLFARKEIVSQPKEATDNAKPSVICLLDQKTSLNISIFLRQFKMPNQDIVAIINDGNCSKISIDQLKALQKLLPDNATIENIKSFDGDISKLDMAGNFFYHLIQVKRYPLRIEAMLVKIEYNDKLTELKKSVELMKLGTKEVLECSLLRDICYVALVAGNIINAGGFAGGAYGFTIGSLCKLKDTRSNKPNMSLLHYISQIFSEQSNWKEELPNLEKASKLSLDNVTSQLTLLDSQVKSLQKKLQNAPEDLVAQHHTFLQQAEQEIIELRFAVDELEKLSQQTAEYFCEKTDTFKINSCLLEIFCFFQEFEKAIKENKQRAILEEKNKERKIQQQSQKPQNGEKTPIPTDDICIFDQLMQEIREGTTLRTTRRRSTRRRSSMLHPNDLKKLQEIVKKSEEAHIRRNSMTPEEPKSPLKLTHKLPSIDEDIGL